MWFFGFKKVINELSERVCNQGELISRVDQGLTNAKTHYSLRIKELERELAHLKMELEDLAKRAPIIKFKDGSPPTIEVEE